MAESQSVAKAFFTATAAGDIDTLRSICSSNFIGTQNGGAKMNIDALAGFTKAVLKRVANFRYENCVVTNSDAGFIEEHDVVADLPDGTTFRLPVCVVAEVSHGKVSNMREYFDSRAADGLLSLMTQQKNS